MASNRTTQSFCLSVDRSLCSIKTARGLGGRRQVASRKEERSAALNYSIFKEHERTIHIACSFINKYGRFAYFSAS
jgi:hypothetical protein